MIKTLVNIILREGFEDFLKEENVLLIFKERENSYFIGSPFFISELNIKQVSAELRSRKFILPKTFRDDLSNLNNMEFLIFDINGRTLVKKKINYLYSVPGTSGMVI